MAENKTRFTDARVEGYLDARDSEQQFADCGEWMARLKKTTQQPPGLVADVRRRYG